MRTKLFVAFTSLLLASVMVASPASADKSGEPAESGIVFRFDPAIGGHFVGPVMTDVGGVTLPILAVFGWDDALTLCNDGPPVFNGVFQGVPSPSGNFSGVTHNNDVPVLVFDVSGVVSEEDFFAKCAAGEIGPLATGTAKQRPTVSETETATNFKVKSQGVVTDASEQDWKLQAFIKVRDLGESQPQVLTEWVKLRGL